ncbi:NAD-dependent epimerase/dehydratase family protein [Kribbella deserti]|uniref:NAD-dependent epimerase/dehydratase family protein n=1 Tax=Kribbella deserti TaxID=1926257 RepID=A0ABV6QSD5_9ACTN
MRLLMLGGTAFVGRAVVEDALARGWDVTVLNRGTTDPNPPKGVTALVGDRTTDEGLGALKDGQWDIVVDAWSQSPRAVDASTRLLADRAGFYAYVSTRGVYEWPPPSGAAEDFPLVEADPTDGDVDYGRAKRGGEIAVERAFGDRGLLVRAGLILGPWENVDRLPWWLRRITKGGPVLAPGPRDLGIQYIDARDLAAWTLDQAVRGQGGAYNVVSPPAYTTIGEILETCVEVTGSDAELRWTEPDVILAAGIEGWAQLPIWVEPGPSYDALHNADVSKALAAGLTIRPVAETIRDTWAWMQGPTGQPARTVRSATGLDPEVEARVLLSS